MGIYVFPNNSVSKQVYFWLRQTWVWWVPCIQNETKEKKTKSTPSPKPGRPVDLFPGKMCEKRRERLCGCCPDLELRSTALSSPPQVWGSKLLKALGSQGRGGWDLFSPSPVSAACSAGPTQGRTRAPLGWTHPTRGSTRSPCRNPWNVAGPGSVYPGSMQREGLKPGISRGAFAHIPLKLFSPMKLKLTGVRRKPPTSSPGRLCLRKVRNPSSVSIQTIPSLCLREEVLPVWKPTWPAQAGVSSWIVAILWQDWVATLGDWLGLACWQLSWIPKVPFLLSPDQLGMEIFKSCSLGIGVELRGICPLLG